MVEFENRGWMLFRAAGELTVLGQEGNALESYPLPSLPVLPQRRQRFLILRERLVDQGSYVLRVRADIGLECFTFARQAIDGPGSLPAWGRRRGQMLTSPSCRAPSWSCNHRPWQEPSLQACVPPYLV